MSKVYKTRFKELSYAKISPGHWQFLDAETNSQVGLVYHSKAELLADLTRYAAFYGCE